MKASGLDPARKSDSEASDRQASCADSDWGTGVSRCAALTVFFVAYAFLIAFHPSLTLRDPDTFWHIRTGQWILENGRWPESDVFSHTFAGQPWIAKEWLSQLVLALAYQLGGWQVVAALTSVVYAAIAATLTVYLSQIIRFSVAIGLTAITLILISPHFLARPHLLGFAILSVWIISLLNALDSERPPSIGLAVWMLLWANIHSTFVLGLMIFYILAGFLCVRLFRKGEIAGVKRTLVVAALVTAATVGTPYGISSLLVTRSIMGMSSIMANLQEWQPPNFRAYPAVLAYLVGFIMLATGAGVKLCLPRLAVLGIMTWLGFSYMRGFFLLLLILPLIMARPTARQVAFLSAQLPDRAGDPVLLFVGRYASVIPVFFCGLAIAATLFSWRLQNVEPPEIIAPSAAINYVKGANIGGAVFNSYGFGGYMIFSGIPTFVDGRAELYGDEFLRKYFAAINLTDPVAAFRLLDDYKIGLAILQPNAPLAKALNASMTWRNVHSDQSAVVFLRRP